MEINPNHAVTKELHDQWHKLCALVMYSANLTELEITDELMQAIVDKFSGEMPAIVADCRNNRMVLRLMVGKAAMELARKEGGLLV